ncbi:MAG: hypothetical protein LBH61_05945 [Dysgonamonadaceae bacterium]|jgi:hypothetical protein|nr:hypothetical protein [Dysgonamonadaceae bacterium]
MHRADFIPRKDADLLQWTANFTVSLAKIYERVGFPYPSYQKLVALRDDFKSKYAIAEAPETRTKATVRQKTEARTALVAALRQAASEYLTHNHLLSDSDRNNLGLPIHKKDHQPSPVADTKPETDVDTSIIGRLTIHFFEVGRPHKKGKPAGQHGAEIAWVMSETPVTEWTDLIHSQIDTNSPLTLEFKNSERGETIYFALRWENTRGEKGPWSEIESAIIP